MWRGVGGALRCPGRVRCDRHKFTLYCESATWYTLVWSLTPARSNPAGRSDGLNPARRVTGKWLRHVDHAEVMRGCTPAAPATDAALWARIAQNVKKPPLTVNVIDFEFFSF